MSRTFQCRTRRTERAAALWVVPAVVLLAGCGGEEAAGEAAEQTPAPPASASAPAGQPASPADPDDPRFGADLEQTGRVLVDTYEAATDFSVEGTTLTVIFSDGSVGFDASIDCLSAGGLMQEGETLVFEYPDGSTEC